MVNVTTASALVAMLLLTTTASASEFEIERPASMATVTMPCWDDKKLSDALTRANFDAVARGLMIKRTDPSQPLVSFWMHLLSGRGLVTVSRADGEECILAVVESAE